MAERALRLFFGLPLPGELQAALDLWQRGHAGIQGWSRPGGLHLTLAFLGERPAAALPSLEATAAAMASRHRPSPLCTAGLGGFPKAAAARVLWLGVEPSQALEALATDLRGGLAAAGEPFDAKPFRAHLTLARLRRPQPASAFAAPAPAAFEVDRLVLFESGPQGCYTPLQAWHLRTV